ncbi:MAG TPA: nucleotidyltransferase family protein [Burkholderiaceae bacterium]|nr:nucleotidyltransferase family protein [Burkholderiaceae bacterium]
MDRRSAEEICVSPRAPPSNAAIVRVLLAAGLGTRYDPTGERLKLLQPVAGGPHAGVPIVAAAARNLRSNLARTFAVVRPLDDPHQPALHELLQREGCELVICEHADQGIGASLACGVRASAVADGWIVALGDMPSINPATIDVVVNALSAGHATAAPSYRGQRGHPVGFSASCRTALLALEGDHGARALLETHPPHLIAVNDAGILIDIDHH